MLDKKKRRYKTSSESTTELQKGYSKTDIIIISSAVVFSSIMLFNIVLFTISQFQGSGTSPTNQHYTVAIEPESQIKYDINKVTGFGEFHLGMKHEDLTRISAHINTLLINKKFPESKQLIFRNYTFSFLDSIQVEADELICFFYRDTLYRIDLSFTDNIMLNLEEILKQRFGESKRAYRYPFRNFLYYNPGPRLDVWETPNTTIFMHGHHFEYINSGIVLFRNELLNRAVQNDIIPSLRIAYNKKILVQIRNLKDISSECGFIGLELGTPFDSLKNCKFEHSCNSDTSERHLLFTKQQIHQTEGFELDSLTMHFFQERLWRFRLYFKKMKDDKLFFAFKFLYPKAKHLDDWSSWVWSYYYKHFYSFLRRKITVLPEIDTDPSLDYFHLENDSISIKIAGNGKEKFFSIDYIEIKNLKIEHDVLDLRAIRKLY